MADITRVYLITGFLGSGKTTFLNRIIARFPKDKKMMILMNEFGEIGIDGTLVEGEDIDMLEISRGSIFCVCVKTDFIKGLYEISTKTRPDVLLMESTGVANPSDLKRDLTLPIFGNRFSFQEQFCLIDALHFLDAYGAYASLEKQIASSTVFIINKVDAASPEVVEQIKKIVVELHPDPLFFETTFADIPLERFFEPVMAGSPGLAGEPTEQAGLLSEEALEKFIDDLLDSPDLEITPPDRLVSVAYRWTGQGRDQIEQMARNLPGSVLRAKGFFEDREELFLFSYVMGDWTIEKPGIPKDRVQQKNTIVLIGPPESMEGIGHAMATGKWTHLGMVQPFIQEKASP
jgi:G3E family GTPase